jgi:hypothetical protein
MKQKTLLPSRRSLTKIAGSEARFVIKRYASTDPDPCQNVTDPQHWFYCVIYVALGTVLLCGFPNALLCTLLCSLSVLILVLNSILRLNKCQDSVRALVSALLPPLRLSKPGHRLFVLLCLVLLLSTRCACSQRRSASSSAR